MIYANAAPTFGRTRLPSRRVVRQAEAGCDQRIDLGSLPPDDFDFNLNGKRVRHVVARVVDIVVSASALVVLFPLLLIVGLVVRLDSRGPVIYRQERLGFRGKPFTLLKFRSMRTDAEAAGPVWASQRDPRVTRVGRFIRATRLDELPQLWNVLKGDMALIGPRPERSHFVETLAAEIPHFRARMLVKPGLTGWAQVNFRYGASIDDARVKLSYDLYYVKHRNLRMNVRIVLGTAKVMLRKEGR